MIISISDPVQSTWIFSAIFLPLLLGFFSRIKNNEVFPVATTQELKGLAILMVIFSHVGYFLVSDHRFLFPLALLAGVEVNLFLFLSGYGLATSSQREPQTIGHFYRRRLIRLFLPVWIALVIFFLLDFFVLHLSYGGQYIVRSFLGYFPSADLYHDVNSPLWYFTIILFYYLIFPLVYNRRRPWLSALAIYLISYSIVWRSPAFFQNVMSLYNIHFAAFPLGIAFAWLLSNLSRRWLVPFVRLKEMLGKSIPRFISRISYYALFIFLLFIIAYTAYYSGVGQGMVKEQVSSLITMLAIILLFLIKKFKLKILVLFGTFSYEIYLLHWPLMYRYDIFFIYLPAWLAVILYLIMFLGLGWVLQRLTTLLLHKFTPKHQTGSK